MRLSPLHRRGLGHRKAVVCPEPLSNLSLWISIQKDSTGFNSGSHKGLGWDIRHVMLDSQCVFLGLHSASLCSENVICWSESTATLSDSYRSNKQNRKIHWELRKYELAKKILISSAIMPNNKISKAKVSG